MKIHTRKHVVRFEATREAGDNWPDLFPIGKLTALRGDSLVVEFLDPIHAPVDNLLGFVSMTVWGSKTLLRKAGNQDTGRLASVTYAHGVAPDEVHQLIRDLETYRWNVPPVKTTP